MTDQLQTAPAVPAHDPGTYRRLPGAHPAGRPRGRRAAARRRVGAVHLVVGGVGRPQRAGEQDAAARGHQLVPALGALPDLDRLGPGRLAHRRRRQPAARPVDGLRRDARRPPQPARRREGRPRHSPTPARCSSRPSPQATEMSERFCDRFQLDMIRFTNSGHRVADVRHPLRRGPTPSARRSSKIEGGYHGGYDALQVSVKPGLDEIGPADAPTPQVPVRRRGRHGPRHRLQRPRRSSTGCSPSTAARSPPWSSSRSSRTSRSSCPTRATSPASARPCDAHGVVLIFDEVKTGLTAGYAGAAQRLGVTPDLITLAKSIGGGLPLAAFGGKREVMEVVVDGRMAHFGTYNGNPLVMAAAQARSTRSAPARRSPRPRRSTCGPCRPSTRSSTSTSCRPTPSVSGVKGCVTWSTTPVRNYRDYKATDFALAELSWLWGVNRHILTPPGLDEQWLVSLVHHRRRHGHPGRRLPRAGPGAARLSAGRRRRGVALSRRVATVTDIMLIIGVVRPCAGPLPAGARSAAAQVSPAGRGTRTRTSSRSSAAVDAVARGRAPATPPASRTGARRTHRTCTCSTGPSVLGQHVSVDDLGDRGRTAGTGSTRSTACRHLPGRFLSCASGGPSART